MPDSQFFVAGTVSSGGHQPWASPIWVYSRESNQIRNLAKMGATAVTDFVLKPPDVIRTGVLDCEHGRGELASRPLVISLHQVMATPIAKAALPGILTNLIQLQGMAAISVSS
jgi:hypothetical protein